MLLASCSAGCFSDAVLPAASRQRGPTELFSEPEAVFMAADGALAVQARARYAPESSRRPQRVRHVVIEPDAIQARLANAVSSGNAPRDVQGRVIVEVPYPDRKKPDQVLPRAFDAPDAAATDLPARFREGQRIDWATAPQFIFAQGRAEHRLKGLNYAWDDREFVLVLTPGSGRTRGRKGVPIEAILGPPAFVLDVVTLPIQLPLMILALNQTGK